MKRQMDRVAWTAEETLRFLQYVSNTSPYWRSALTLAILTGLRAGELYALRWDEVDLEERLIRVTSAYNHKTRTYNPYPKNRRLRYVPVNDTLEGVLRGLMSLPVDTGGYVLPRNWAFDAGVQSKTVGAYCRESGVPVIRFHDLRAIYASTLLKGGVSLIHVMQVCGWSQLSTAQRYLRLSGKEVVGLTDTISFPVDTALSGEKSCALDAPLTPQALSQPIVFVQGLIQLETRRRAPQLGIHTCNEGRTVRKLQK